MNLNFQFFLSMSFENKSFKNYISIIFGVTGYFSSCQKLSSTRKKISKFILSYLDTWPTKTWSIPKEKVLQQVFFFLRRPIRFHCIIIKTRSCKLWSSSQTWLSTYHVKNKKKERLFIWNKGSSWSSKRGTKWPIFSPNASSFQGNLWANLCT